MHNGLSLPVACDRLLQRSVLANRSRATLAAQRQDLAALVPFLEAALGRPSGEIGVADLTARAMEDALASWCTSRRPTKAERAGGATTVAYAPATQARMQSTWAGLFAYLVRAGELAGSPMAAIDRPRVPQPVPKPLAGWAEDTVPRLVGYARSAAWGASCSRAWPARDLAMVALLLGAGLRRSELLGLSLGSLDGPPGGRFFRVLGKGRKTRTVPVGAELEEAVGAYAVERRARWPGREEKAGDPLFVAKGAPSRPPRPLTGRQLDYLLERLLVGAALAGRKPRGALAHGLRHTYGSGMAAAGVPMPELARLMGHASIRTTQGYTDVSEAGTRSAAAKAPVLGALREGARRAQGLPPPAPARPSRGRGRG